MATSTARKRAGRTSTALSARLLELAAQTNDPQPYEVTDAITVTPPTRTRRTAMNAAEAKLYIARSLLAKAVDRATAAGPVLPADPSDEQRAEHATAAAAWEQQAARAEEQVNNLNAEIGKATQDYERAFFGDVYDAVIEYFEDKPNLWDLFIPDIKAEFLPPAPDNGVCPQCGRVDDEEAAERAPKSSTSSTTTGTT